MEFITRRCTLFLVLGIITLFPVLRLEAQWKKLASNLGGIGITYSSGNIWVIGKNKISMSSDDGKTWTSFQSPLIANETPTDIDFFDRFNGIVTGDSNGVYITHDGGLSWNRTAINFPKVSQAKFLGSPLKIIAGGNPEIALSMDGGTTINFLSPGPFSTGWCQDLLVKRKNNSIYYLAVSTSGSKVISSPDGGTTWTATTGLLNYDSHGLAIDSCLEDAFYVMNEGTYRFEKDRKGRVFYSHDGGASFIPTKLEERDYYAGSIISTEDGILYAGTVYSSGDGIIRSRDGGKTWKSIGGPICSFDSHGLCCKNNNTIFALERNGDIWGTFNSGGDSIPALKKLVVSGATPISESPALAKTDDTVHVHIHITFPPNTPIDSAIPAYAEFTLAFDNRTIDIAPTTANIIPPLGWKLGAADIISPGMLFITLVDTTPLYINHDQDFGTVIFKINSHPKRIASYVSLTKFIVYSPRCDTAGMSYNVESSILRNIEAVVNGVRDIETNEEITLSLQPNPAGDILSLITSGDMQKAKLSLYDELGKSWISQEITFRRSVPEKIDISILPEGLYLLKIESKEGFLSKSVVVRR